MIDNKATIASVIGSGHSFNSHKNEFSDPALGRAIDISSKNLNAAPSGLARYILEALQSDKTRVFTTAADKTNNRLPTSFIYNTQDNTLLILDANHSEDFGTIYRPNAGSIKFERLRESAGFPPVKKGSKAVQHAVNVFENSIFKSNPEAWHRLEQMAQKLQVPVHEPKTLMQAHKQAGKATTTGGHPDALLSIDVQSEKNEPDLPENYIRPEIAEILKDTDNTLGLWADKEARVTHYMNEKHKAVVTLSPAAQCVHRFEDAQDAYDFLEQKIQESARARGEEPQLVSGGHAALSAQYKQTMGKPPRVGSDLSDIGKQLRRAAQNGCTNQFNHIGQPGDSRVSHAQPVTPGILSFIKDRIRTVGANRDYNSDGMVPG